jgi:holo-[acyl-carrier protein] synthase
VIGIDVVDIARLRGALQRAPGLAPRLFSDAERAYCEARRDPATSFAGTLAAKEAVVKALRLSSLAAWAARIEIERGPSGAPSARVEGGRDVDVSISHDGPVAVAVALARDP